MFSSVAVAHRYQSCHSFVVDDVLLPGVASGVLLLTVEVLVTPNGPLPPGRTNTVNRSDWAAELG